MKSAKSATAHMIDVLGDMIRCGEILPGERLPAERTLAEKNGVARNTVRAAIQHYATLGLIRSDIGSGNYLVEDSEALYRVIEAKQLIERYNEEEMLETRRLLETGIVALAAERANRTDKLNLNYLCNRCCNAATATKTQRAEFAQLNYQLHLGFAQTAKNSFLLEMFESVKDTFLEVEQVLCEKPGETQKINEANRKITDAINSNNVEDAVKETLNYFDFI